MFSCLSWFSSSQWELCALLTCPLPYFFSPSEISLLSGTKRCSAFIFYFLYLNPGISFPRSLVFFCFGRTVCRNQDLETAGMLNVTRLSLFLSVNGYSKEICVLANTLTSISIYSCIYPIMCVSHSPHIYTHIFKSWIPIYTSKYNPAAWSSF